MTVNNSSTTNNHNGSLMRSMPLVNAVEDRIIDPIGNRLSWFSTISSIFDVIIPIELTTSWYTHIVYAKHDGATLRTLFTQRFAAISTMVSLLVSTQIAVMFSPSEPTQKARDAMANLEWGLVSFWAGTFLAISIIFSICSLLATLSAWAIFNAVGNDNSHIILRSTMCQNAAALPVRLALLSIYNFFIWLNLFWHVIAQRWMALVLSLFCLLFVIYVTSMYSAVGRVIMYSGALGDEDIMGKNDAYKESMTGQNLANALTEKVKLAKEANIPVNMQYKIRYQEQLQQLEEGGSLRMEEFILPEFRGTEFTSSSMITALPPPTEASGNSANNNVNRGDNLQYPFTASSV